MRDQQRRLFGLRHLMRPARNPKTEEDWNAYLDSICEAVQTCRVEVSIVEPEAEDPTPPKKKKQGKTREHTGGEVREDSE